MSSTKTAPLPNGNGDFSNGGYRGAEKPEGNKCTNCCCCSLLGKISDAITSGIEKGFARLGLAIGRRPWTFILVTSALACLCGLGLAAFVEETDPAKLWVPVDAGVLDDKDWVDDYYGANVRREEIIVTATNVLTPTALEAMLDIYEDSFVRASGTTTLNDVCIKAGTNCIVNSILELWSYNRTEIEALNTASIINTVNTVTVSPMYGGEIDLTTLLGARTVNPATGYVESAEAAYMLWLARGEDAIEDTTEAWEDAFIDMGRAGHANLTTFVYAAKSFDEESDNAIGDDVLKLSIGYFLVILFVLSVLGRFNLMEQRAWMTLAGFLCVGLAILVSMGLSSAFQQDYGPVHSVLPFLLLGIGVDDMFVIIGAQRNLSPDEEALPVPEKVSAILRHAGVSITVTSFTDFMAFMIGATTIIPALRSFCVYAGMGVLALFILQAIVFTGFLAIDIRRQEEERDACLFCIKHPSPPYQANKCSKFEVLPWVFKNVVAKVLCLLPFQICVVITAIALFGVNLYGFVELEQYFDPYWFLPSDSYAKEFQDALDDYFPNAGSSGYIYCGNLNYWNLRTEVENLDSAMSSSSVIRNGTTDSWFKALVDDWLATTSDADVLVMLDPVTKYPLNEANFNNLTYRMQSEIYTRTSNYLQFIGDSDIKASRFPFDHKTFDNSEDQIDAMEDTRDLTATVGMPECFPYMFAYLTWETNKVIQEELYRNLLLAMICVFLVTLILISNLRTSSFVFLGVVFTLVDVAGSMHFWDLTIDTVTCIILILAIGLAVDYSAHIGHTFMTIRGDKKTRMATTIAEMGPPVFYGGFSTFLAFLLLADSTSYVFKTFFKVNLLVVMYGLFHGLIFVPVLLCWLGPEPYPHAEGGHGGASTPPPPKNDPNGIPNPAFVVSDRDPSPSDKMDREMTNMSNQSNGSNKPAAEPHGVTLHPAPTNGSTPAPPALSSEPLPPIVPSQSESTPF